MSSTPPDSPDRGAWLPRAVVERLPRLELRRPSRWRVYLAVLFQAARYGGGDALLSVDDLVRMTGLSERSVKGALTELQAAGLIVRVGRARRLSVPLLTEPIEPAKARPAFTRRQEHTVVKALAEIGMLLLCGDASSLALPPGQAERLELAPGTTFGAAFEAIRQSGNRTLARVFVGMVLELRYSERVQGRPVG